MNLPIRKRLDEEGMQPYLDRTRLQHNNLGYKELIVDMKNKVSKAASARKYGVTDKTMKGWQERIRIERELQLVQSQQASQEFTE